MPIALPKDQKALERVIDRRHPAYDARLAHWKFCRATYDGGRDWFKDNIFRYVKEGPTEYAERIDRAYRFNHTREVVGSVTKYIFKSGVIRNNDDAPKPLKQFWQSATIDGKNIDALMRRANDLSAIYGRVWIGIDSKISADGALITLADEKAGAARIFGYHVTPEDMLDWCYDDHGKLLWVKFRFLHRDNEDPVGSSGELRVRYAFWSKEDYIILEETKERSNKRSFAVIKHEENPIGEVPFVCLDDRDSDDPYDVPALIGDIAYLDRSVGNYLSNLDAIIQDQTFSQLAMPAQGLLPGEDAHSKLIEMGTKRVFTYDGEGGEPRYLSPDAAQAGVILAVINKIISEIYHTVGMAGERTKQDNAVGIDNSSGVAKAYDFERMNSLLAAKGDMLDKAENDIARLVLAWAGAKMPRQKGGGLKDLVKYPDSYDVRNLYDEFEVADKLLRISAPDTVRQQQMASLVEKLFPRIAEDTKVKMAKDIASWPPEPVMDNNSSVTNENVGDNRQGQVTDKTPGAKRGREPVSN